MKKKNWSRTLSLLLAVALVAGLLVVPAAAVVETHEWKYDNSTMASKDFSAANDGFYTFTGKTEIKDKNVQWTDGKETFARGTKVYPDGNNNDGIREITFTTTKTGTLSVYLIGNSGKSLSLTKKADTGDSVVATNNCDSSSQIFTQVIDAGNYSITAGGGEVDIYCIRWVEKSTEAQPAESVTISPKNVLLKVGEKETLSATTGPMGTTETEVTWSADSSGVVSVDADSGEVTANKTGTATVTATVKDHVGDPVTDTAEIRVYDLDPAAEKFELVGDTVFQGLESNGNDGKSNPIYTMTQASEVLSEQGTKGFFTIYGSSEANKSKIDYSKKTFGDAQYEYRINLQGGAKVKEASIGFTTGSAALVEVCAVAGGENRPLVILDDGGSEAAKGVARNNGDQYTETLLLDKAGTYYLGGDTGNDYIFKVTVTTTEAAAAEDKEMTVTAADVTANYDGKAKTITVKATDKGAETAVTGAEVQYKLSTEGEEAYKNTQPEMKNAGTYKVDYKVTAEGYKEATGQATVTINKNTEAQGKITLEADHNEVTQSDGEVLFTVKGVPTDSEVVPTLKCDKDDAISVTLTKAPGSSDYTGTYNVAASDGGEEKTHVVSVEWAGDDNYEGITTASEGQKVTITQHSSSAQVSQVEFAEMSANIYAKAGSLVGETQQSAFVDGAITFTADPDKDTTQTVEVSGKLKYAEGLTDFNKSNPKEQEGYYLLWMFEVPTEYQTAGTVTVKKGASSTTDKTFSLSTAGLDEDGGKQYFSMVHQISPKTGTVEILVDGDGAGSDYIETVYTLNLSGVTFEPLNKQMGADFVVAGTLSTEDVGGTLTATATKVGYETYEVTVNSTGLTAHKRTGVEPADTEDDFWIGVGLPQINFDNNSLFVSEDGTAWQHIGGNQVDKGGKKYSMTYVNLPDDAPESGAELKLYYKVTPDKDGEADPTGETLQYYTVTFKADKLTYPDYTITNGTTTGETGTISAIKVKDAAGTTAKAGDTITVETTPAENYTLDAVTVTSDVEGIEVEVSKVGNNATFTMPASNVTVTATFKEGTTPKTITVVAAPLGEGSSAESYEVTGSGDEGGTVNVTIAADSLTKHANGDGTEGYWVGFGMPVEEGATYTYKADEGDTATTEVNGPKDRTFTKDGKTYATIYMTVDEANTETKYTVTQTKTGEPAVTTTYKVTITVKALVPAETEPETTYDLTGVATPENSGTVTFTVGGTAATTAKESDTVTVVATPETGYKLKSVTAVQTGTDTAVTIGADNTFTMPAAAVTVTATFEKEEEPGPKPLPENAVVWTDARKDQVDMFTFWVKNASGEFEEGYSAKPTSGITAAMLEGALKDFTDYLDTTSLAVKFKPNSPDVGKTTFTTATSGTLTLVFIDQASKENQAGCTLDGQVINGFVDGTKETVSVREIELEAGDHVFLSGRDTYDKEISMYLMMWVPDGDAPTTPTVTSVTIEGPNTVKVGAEIELTATVAMSDGSTDAAGVTWTASNSNATVEAGKVTGVTAGEVVITATSVTDATKSNTKTITVTAEDAGGDEVDKSALQAAVDAAHKKYDDVVASEDGTDVRTTKEWMPEADLKAAQDAIAAAEAVLKDESADADAVKNAVDALANALSGLAEPAAGTKRTSSGVSHGTTGGVGVDKENTDKTTETKPDGSKVVTETKSDGSKTVTETKPDGSKTVTTTTPAGEVTADVTLGHGASSTTVTVPVEDANTGMVPVVVNPDGTEEIIRDSYVDEDGNVVFDLDESATVKIVDNAKHFVDIDNHWAEDDVNFVTARELFNGMDTTHFVPNDAMTRAMMATVLFRLDGENASEAAIDFADVKAGDWFVEAVDWAAEMGVITGYSDGTFAPDKSITRQELVAMVYRFAGSPAVEGAMGMAGYDDADEVADWASAAMHWAVANGIIQGKGDNCIHPAGEATRAEVAAVLQRFVRLDK